MWFTCWHVNYVYERPTPARVWIWSRLVFSVTLLRNRLIVFCLLDFLFQHRRPRLVSSNLWLWRPEPGRSVGVVLERQWLCGFKSLLIWGKWSPACPRESSPVTHVVNQDELSPIFALSLISGFFWAAVEVAAEDCHCVCVCVCCYVTSSLHCLSCFQRFPSLCRAEWGYRVSVAAETLMLITWPSETLGSLVSPLHVRTPHPELIAEPSVIRLQLSREPHTRSGLSCLNRTNHGWRVCVVAAVISCAAAAPQWCFLCCSAVTQSIRRPRIKCIYEGKNSNMIMHHM